MKNKNIFVIILLIVLMLIFIYSFIYTIPNKVFASSTSNSASDVQLLARAINGEARGEPYEGQVAVRSCNFK